MRVKIYIFFIFCSPLCWSRKADSFKDHLKKTNKLKIMRLLSELKSDKINDKKRWRAGMEIIKKLGVKSLPLMRKLGEHPDWMLRLLSLKAIRLLKDKTSLSLIERSLFDKSGLVRVEALDLLGDWKIKKSGRKIWKMLSDKKNYLKSNNKTFANKMVVSKIIETIKILKYSRVKKHLLNLRNKKEFKAVALEIDETLKSL